MCGLLTPAIVCVNYLYVACIDDRDYTKARALLGECKQHMSFEQCTEHVLSAQISSVRLISGVKNPAK